MRGHVVGEVILLASDAELSVWGWEGIIIGR
jgi:hypothetical protein